MNGFYNFGRANLGDYDRTGLQAARATGEVNMSIEDLDLGRTAMTASSRP